MHDSISPIVADRLHRAGVHPPGGPRPEEPGEERAAAVIPSGTDAKGSLTARAARIAGLRSFETPTLEAVEHRLLALRVEGAGQPGQDVEVRSAACGSDWPYPPCRPWAYPPCRPCACTFAHVSFSVSVRLKTSAPGTESGSGAK